MRSLAKRNNNLKPRIIHQHQNNIKRNEGGQIQQRVIERAFDKLNLTSLEEFLYVPSSKFTHFASVYPIYRSYEHNILLLLQTLYPNYPWPSSIPLKRNEREKVIKEEENLSDINNQRKFIDKLFYKMKLNSLDEWENLSKFQFIKNGGKKLIEKYENSLPRLFSTLYPFYPFESFKYKSKYRFYQLIDHQRQFADELFKKLKLNSLEEWINISKLKWIENGGYSILLNYSYKLSSLLISIYPYYPWPFQFSSSSLLSPQLKLDKQKQKMQKIFKKLNLNDLNDWLKITKNQFIINGGKNLFSLYKNDFANLLKTIYPKHDWSFSSMKFRNSSNPSSLFSSHLKRILIIKEKYLIREEKDWYRLNLRTDDVDIFKSLKIIFPHHQWKRKEFILRMKKTNQRLLFITLQKMYSHLNIIEDYHHPLFTTLLKSNLSSSSIQFDIFIGELNIAIEYQGQQHYDDMPNCFSQLELYKSRDQRKKSLSNDLKVQLISIPYWWSLSPSSLFSSFQFPKIQF